MCVLLCTYVRTYVACDCSPPQVVPYTRSVRGGPCGGVVGIENVGDSPMPEPTSVLPECEVTKCDGDGDGGSPRPGAPVVAFVTPGPAGGLLSFQGQPCTHCEVCSGE